MRGAEALHRIDDFDAPDALFRVAGGEPALFDQLPQRLRDAVLCLACRAGLRVIEERACAALRQYLRDAATHGAGAGHAGDEIAAVGI